MRVFVVAEPSMFDEGIQAILRQEPGLEIVGRETDPQEAIGRIKEAHPDVVVLTDGEPATGLVSELLRLVGEGFHVRIVEIHLETNSLCVYCGEQQSIREVRDLVDSLGHLCHGLTEESVVPLSPGA
jgi:DNA-binding NarL/FixJ family response regulator